MLSFNSTQCKSITNEWAQNIEAHDEPESFLPSFYLLFKKQEEKEKVDVRSSK